MEELNINLNIDGIQTNFKYLCNEEIKALDLFKHINDFIIPKLNISSETRDLINVMVSDNSSNSFGFITPVQEMRILRKNVPLLDLLNYLNIDYNSVIITNYGGIGAMFCSTEGIKFYTHSNEENHKHNPHIHTEYQNKEASYSIITGQKLAGANYSTKIEKLIKRIISDHQDELKVFWLDTTNGLWPMSYPFEIEIR